MVRVAVLMSRRIDRLHTHTGNFFKTYTYNDGCSIRVVKSSIKASKVRLTPKV